MPATALPPGPKGRFITGSLRDFAARRLDFFTDVARQYGDIATFRLGPRRVFLVNHPDLIEQVLVTDAKHYVKHFGARMYKPVLGNGLVTSEGDFWLRQRRLSQPAFHKSRLLAYAPTMTDLAERHVADWRPGDARDIHDDMSRLTSAIALKTLFGLDAPADRESFVVALDEAFAAIGKRFRTLFPFPLWLPTPNNLRIKRSVAKLQTIVRGFIEQGLARTEPGDDLLSRLVNARDEDGGRMDDRQLLDETMTLYLAGHETTALTLSWAWYLLAKHPAAEAKLVEEWQRVLGDRTPTAADVPNLPYTDCVLNETMRVRPPVYLIGREATRELELGGYRVPRGTTVFLCQWATHRDPRWFDDPEAFRPERWADGLAKRLPKYAYFPFGGGPRVCIGNAFAQLEAALLLPIVGRRWRFTLAESPPVVPFPSITLIPEFGIPAILRERK